METTLSNHIDTQSADDPSGEFLEKLSVMSAEAMGSSRFQAISSIEEDPGIGEILSEERSAGRGRHECRGLPR